MVTRKQTCLNNIVLLLDCFRVKSCDIIFDQSERVYLIHYGVRDGLPRTCWLAGIDSKETKYPLENTPICLIINLSVKISSN